MRLDGSGKVLGKHEPVVTPFDGRSSAGAKVMSVAHGPKGIFFTGDGAGTFPPGVRESGGPRFFP